MVEEAAERGFYLPLALCQKGCFCVTMQNADLSQLLFSSIACLLLLLVYLFSQLLEVPSLLFSIPNIKTITGWVLLTTHLENDSSFSWSCWEMAIFRINVAEKIELPTLWQNAFSWEPEKPIVLRLDLLQIWQLYSSYIQKL